MKIKTVIKSISAVSAVKRVTEPTPKSEKVPATRVICEGGELIGQCSLVLTQDQAKGLAVHGNIELEIKPIVIK